MIRPPLRLAVPAWTLVVCLGLTGCAPSSSSSSESSDLPTGRQTAESTQKAVESARDAGSTGLIYASNLDQSSGDASSGGFSPSSTSHVERSTSGKSADDATGLVRRVTFEIGGRRWMGSDGSSIGEMEGFRKWWMAIPDEDEPSVHLTLRLVDDIAPDDLSRALEIARKGGAEAIDLRFDGGELDPSKDEPFSGEHTDPDHGGSSSNAGADVNADTEEPSSDAGR